MWWAGNRFGRDLGFRDTLLKRELGGWNRVERGERSKYRITGRRCGRWDTDGTSCTWWRTWAPCSSCPTCEWTWAAAAGPPCGPWWGSWSPGCPAGSKGSWRHSWCTESVSSGPSSSAHPASTLSSSSVLQSASGHPSPSSPPWFSSWGLRDKRGRDILTQHKQIYLHPDAVYVSLPLFVFTSSTSAISAFCRYSTELCAVPFYTSLGCHQLTSPAAYKNCILCLCLCNWLAGGGDP